MLKQYSAVVDKFGKAYTLIEATQKDNMVSIEYYLIFDDKGNASIKGGVLEVEALLENTLESYLNEHVTETLPYMVIRALVDSHTPEELEGLSEIKFGEDSTVASILKGSYPNLAALIFEKCTSLQVKELMK